MHFTQEDYIKIENWLHRNSVKDTEFQEALPFTGKEIVTIVQDGHNRKVNIQEFINQLYKHGVEDFLNVTNTYRANNITLKEAIRLIPAEARKEGQVITFLNTDGNWEIYQFIGKLNQWNNPTLWNNPFDWEKLIVDSILPDEEDLTKSAPDAKGNSYLSLKDRKYEPDKYSGLGRVILRKNIVEIDDPIYGKVTKNILFQDMIAQSNTIYEIRYDFDLNGREITIPVNCVLDFRGGSLSNGKVIGDSSILLSVNNYILSDISIEGTWCNNNVKVDWFNIGESQDSSVKAVKNAVALCGQSSTLEFGARLYYINMIKPKSNMVITGCGNETILKLMDNSPLYNHPIQINNTYNVSIKNLTIDGNYTRQELDTAKFGIYILNSHNTLIENVIIKECSEGIFLGYSGNPTFDVIINNCKICNSYRNAIAFLACERVSINGLTLVGYKESSALLDIELHADVDFVRDVVFKNSTFTLGEGEPIKILSNKHSSVFGNISFVNCNIDSYMNIQYFDNIHIINSRTKDIEIIGSKNIDINNSYCSANITSGAMINIYNLDGFTASHININNCYIEQLNTDKVSSGVAVMGTNNIFIHNSSIKGFNRGVLISYENNNIHIDNSCIENNNIGLGVVGVSYKGLYISNSLFNNTINYQDIVSSQTYFNAHSSSEDEDGFITLNNITSKRLRIKGTRNDALNGEFYEDNISNIPHFKNSKGSVFQIGEKHFAAPSPPSGTPTYIGQRYLYTTYNVYYNAVYVLDSNGNPTYDLKWAPEIFFNTIPPHSFSPDYIGQKYYDMNTKTMYMGLGLTPNDWVVVANHS